MRPQRSRPDYYLHIRRGRHLPPKNLLSTNYRYSETNPSGIVALTPQKKVFVMFLHYNFIQKSRNIGFFIL